MPPLLPTLKGGFGMGILLRRNTITAFIIHNNNVLESGNYVPVRCLSSIAGIDCYSSTNNCEKRNFSHSLENGFSTRQIFQRRWFLGCGDGEEGSALSKVHEEKLVLGYSPEQLFVVVAAVDLYEDFLPWCQRSDIIRHFPDGSFDAELEIGFKFLVESYTSHVIINKPKLIKVASMFFKEVVSKLVNSFTDRCRLIYGPGIEILQSN